MKNYILLIAIILLTQKSFSQDITWNGSVSSDWNNSLNWTPNIIPSTTSHNVIINNATVSHKCLLNANRSIRRLDLNDGAELDLNNFTLTISDRLRIEEGVLKNGNIITPNINRIQNSTFIGSISITKTSSSTGNNDLEGGNRFIGNITFINEDNSRLRLAEDRGDTFKAHATFIRTGTGSFEVARRRNNYFEGDINCEGTILFGENNGVVIINGNDSQNINWNSIGNKPNFPNLTMNTSQNGELTLNTPIDIEDNLTLTSGVINTTTANIIRLTDESTTTSIGNANSFISGPMEYNLSNNSNSGFTLNFPIGKKLTPKNYYPEYYIWRPISLLVGHTHSATYTYRAEVFNNYYNNSNWTLPGGIDTASRARSWDIQRYLTSNMTNTPSNQLRTNATSGQRPIITLYFGYSDSVYDGSNLTILKNTSDSPNAWIDIGGTGAPVYNNRTPLAGSITSTGTNFNSFSTFTLGSLSTGFNPLPLKLLDFKATEFENDILVNWSTTEEKNTDYFEVEKSIDGKNWYLISRIDAAEETQNINLYHALDKNVNNGIHFYRLKQFDIDGSFEYSKTVRIVKNSIPQKTITIYPNPAQNEILILNNHNIEELINWRIINTIGKTVLSGESEQNQKIDISSLSNGIYYLQINQFDKIENIKLIISR
ncbi:MAG: T9SS type A sorting domain-containing protein [Bacteroidota bacterium]|nr:T9SS type A sorting domain-containing protein [Bacteroidota bacterium]